MFDRIKLYKGQPSYLLERDEFIAEFRKDFFDPRFRDLDQQINQLAEQAWQNYSDRRKAPVTVKAGAGFKDPDYDLSTDWLSLRDRLIKAESEQKTTKSRILLINGSPRSEHTCPGEMSKSFRLMEEAQKTIEAEGFECEILDLSRVTSDYKAQINPCKACVSTAMPLCHWPCSCYPNHSAGQTHDWMSEIYEMWVKAHGIMIITPVHWYQVPSPLKLMMDRLVCADGGNPDPTSTQGKDAKKAKQIELDGWDFPKHLAGRAFSLVVHGDSTGIEEVKHALTGWLTDMDLIPAGKGGVAASYIGYYEPYAKSHEALDKNKDFWIEAESAAKSLVNQVRFIREAQYMDPDKNLNHPMQK